MTIKHARDKFAHFNLTRMFIMENRKLPQTNPNATWANKEVRKLFQMAVDEYVKFYKEHGKDKNRDCFIFVRISLKKTLNLLFQEKMPETAKEYRK